MTNAKSRRKGAPRANDSKTTTANGVKRTTALKAGQLKSITKPGLRPIRAETRARLVTAIAKGRRWLDALMAETATNVEQIAGSENCTVRQINMTISLAFLAPNLVQAAVDGRLPRGVGIADLRDAPAEWSLQYARLGLAS